MEQALPNPGHLALAELERRVPGRWTVVTQNVDSLHPRAGSQRVLELHGNIARVKCSVNASADFGIAVRNAGANWEVDLLIYLFSFCEGDK